MTDQKLLDYIRQQLQRGVNKNEIKNALLSSGWQEQTVDDCFNFLSGSTASLGQPAVFRQATSSLPGAKQILMESWSIYKRRFRTLIGIQLLPVLILLLIPISGIFIDHYPLLIRGLYFTMFSFVGLWTMASSIYAISNSQNQIGVIAAYRVCLSKTPYLLWVNLVIALITLVGFILFIIPGIIFSVWFIFAGFVLISEDLKGLNAILKSRYYVRGRWTGVFWRLLFIMTLTSYPSLQLWFVLGSLNTSFHNQISTVVNLLFLYPFANVYLFLIYRDLKALKNE